MVGRVVAACGLMVVVLAAGEAGLGQCEMGWAEGFAARGPDGPVYALASFDDGSGPALYVGGYFWHAGEIDARNIARWDGTAFSPVSGGMDDWVGILRRWDDGTGPALYAGGCFQAAGGVPVSNLARWDGIRWSPLGSGVSDQVYAMDGFSDSGERALYVGGRFMRAGEHPSANVARWSCVRTPGDTNCDGLVDERDIDPFVWAIVDQSAYRDRYPGCNWLNADLSGDDRVDFGDINPFIAVLERP